jgi:hypothetical protein
MSKTSVINARLTLTIDDEFENLLQTMRQAFPLLKDTDLVKMAISGFYGQNSALFSRLPDLEEEKAITNYSKNPELASDSDVAKLEKELGVALR